MAAVTRVDWRRSGADVLAGDIIPPEVICECGSTSVPKNVTYAEQISKLPVILKFLDKILEDVEVYERVGHKEARMRTTLPVVEKLVRDLEAAGIPMNMKTRFLRGDRSGD